MSLVASVMRNDLVTPFHRVLEERRKRKNLLERGNFRFRSLYRDLLFLAFRVLGRENIDHGKLQHDVILNYILTYCIELALTCGYLLSSDSFDREYRLAYSRLGRNDVVRLRPSDKPPTRATVCCRKVFRDLDL